MSVQKNVVPKNIGPKKSLVQKISPKIWARKKNLVQNKFWSKKVLVRKNFSLKKNFGPKKFGPKKLRSKKNLGSKRILVQQKFVREKSCKWKYNATTATPVLVPKIGGGMTFQTMSYDFPTMFQVIYKVLGQWHYRL